MKITLIHKDGRIRKIPVRDGYGCMTFTKLDELETIIIDLEKNKELVFVNKNLEELLQKENENEN